MMSHIPKLVEAINTRRSCHSFLPYELRLKDYEQVINFTKEMITPFDHQVNISLYIAPQEKSVVYFHGFSSLLMMTRSLMT